MIIKYFLDLCSISYRTKTSLSSSIMVSKVSSYLKSPSSPSFFHSIITITIPWHYSKPHALQATMLSMPKSHPIKINTSTTYNILRTSKFRTSIFISHISHGSREVQVKQHPPGPRSRAQRCLLQNQSGFEKKEKDQWESNKIRRCLRIKLPLWKIRCHAAALFQTGFVDGRAMWKYA